MAKLVLKFDGRTIDEYGVGLMVSIGRTPDNSLAIDNPAVSSHHACVFRDGDDFVIEDFGSTNGTFVNQKRVARHTLRHGDEILVGKHTLLFDADGTAAPLDADGDQPTLGALGDTVFLDTKQHRALLAKLTVSQGAPGRGAAAARYQTPPAMAAVLRVVSGRADQPEYRLDRRTALIGTSRAALVRLQGWFKPVVAVALERSGESYVATHLRGSARVNGSPLRGRYELKEGDVLKVCGLTLEFRSGR